MSTYNQAADQAEKQLSFISKTMCYAKWAQVSMHLTNGMTHSCYHPPLHKIDIRELKHNPTALHNTTQKKQERSLMLKGERPDGCSYCWKIEDTGARSDRIYRSGEYWAQNARKDIIESLDTGNIDPRYVEVNFNQACNFKCMYCSPHLSTTWEDEIKEHGAFQILEYTGQQTLHNDIIHLEKKKFMPLKVKQEDNPYLKAFWQWWPSLYKKLEVFRITGGEPLVDANTFRVMDYIYEHPNSDLEVSVTSNLCPPKPELMKKFIEKLKKLEEIQIWENLEKFNQSSGNHWYVNMALKNFALFVSVDSVGSQAEYIRTGLDFKQMTFNVQNILNETVNTTITFINTFNVLSVPRCLEYVQYILELRRKYSRTNQGVKFLPILDKWYDHKDYEIHPRQRIWFDIPLLRNPAWQAYNILPVEYDHYLANALNFMKQHTDTSDFVGFYDFEIAKMERNLAIFRDRDNIDLNRQKIDRENFTKFFQQYDQRRELDFQKTFPELANLYQGNWQ